MLTIPPTSSQQPGRRRAIRAGSSPQILGNVGRKLRILVQQLTADGEPRRTGIHVFTSLRPNPVSVLTRLAAPRRSGRSRAPRPKPKAENMKNLTRIFASLIVRLREEAGQTMAEYAILTTVIALVVIVAAKIMGSSLSSIFSSMAGHI
jgi:Flp pilus assembly pilin Flp